MGGYLLKRLLLVPVTLIGVTVLVFLITRLVPGGPLERAIAEAQRSGSVAAVAGQGMALSQDQLDQLREYYRLDRPFFSGYAEWAGSVVRGDLGRSYRYQEPVVDVIASRLPVTLFFGLATLLLTYAVSVPLGVLKAIRHQTPVDHATSVLIFVGYAVPGYALGSLLLLVFSAQLGWFPLGGFTGPYFDELEGLARIADLARHAALPLLCYVAGSFALTTMLVKNNLLDQLAADYVRTAIAKGLSFRAAVLRHALRNSLIPVATTVGQNVALVVTGSFLIETIFDLNGLGLLGVSAVFDRDYPVVMGIVLLTSVALLLGNILSDLLVAAADPRVSFA